MGLQKVNEFGLPRRCDIRLQTPPEKAIREALVQVEAIGADILLTDAVVMLANAANKVADYLELDTTKVVKGTQAFTVISTKGGA